MGQIFAFERKHGPDINMDQIFTSQQIITFERRHWPDIYICTQTMVKYLHLYADNGQIFTFERRSGQPN